METEELGRLSAPAGDRSNVQMTIGGFLHEASSWFAFSFSTMHHLRLHAALVRSLA